jgi:hypothetical protein
LLNPLSILSEHYHLELTKACLALEWSHPMLEWILPKLAQVAWSDHDWSKAPASGVVVSTAVMVAVVFAAGVEFSSEYPEGKEGTLWLQQPAHVCQA